MHANKMESGVVTFQTKIIMGAICRIRSSIKDIENGRGEGGRAHRGHSPRDQQEFRSTLAVVMDPDGDI